MYVRIIHQLSGVIMDIKGNVTFYATLTNIHCMVLSFFKPLQECITFYVKV